MNFSKIVKADILITTETHWKDTEPTTNPKLKRWSITQSSNNAAHASGGVAVWCRQNFTITNKFISERMVSVDIERNNHKFRIIAIYGPTGDKRTMLEWWKSNQNKIQQLISTNVCPKESFIDT